MENFSLNNEPLIGATPINDSETITEKNLETYDISLLEEKLVVQRRQQKVGEVIVRKEIETRMIHIPIRREKLIIEKAGITTEHLTEVDLGEGEVNGIKFSELDNSDDIYQAQSQFVSLDTIKNLLTKISEHSGEGKIKMRLEIITDNSEAQKVYQDICDRELMP